MKDTEKILKEMLAKHSGIAKSDLNFAVLLASVQTLEMTLLKTRYTEGSEEMRKAYEDSQTTFKQFLDWALDFVKDPKISS